MDAAKIQLSEEEAALVMRSDWILTKNRIIQKVKGLLELIQQQQQEFLSSTPSLPKEVLSSGAKISKGENYRGLPYLVLDQPRFFSKNEIFAIRTMFWWGHFFSTTLHISGHYKVDYADKIINAYEHLKKNGFHICINEEQWEHHFEDGNFVLIETMHLDEFKKIIEKQSFIKISAKIPLSEWNRIGESVMQNFTELIEVMIDEDRINYRGDEINPLPGDPRAGFDL